MTEFIFLQIEVVKALHKMQIERFGGAHGLRDEGILESALNRPVNKAGSGVDDVCELAAAYLFGLARNHALVDGHKRIAIVTAAGFLMANRYMLPTDQATLYTFVLRVAPGELDEAGARLFLNHPVAAPR